MLKLVCEEGPNPFLQCVSFVQGWWQELVELLPGLLQPSAAAPVTWKVLGVHITLWKETHGCALCVPGGGDGRAGNRITAIWSEDLLSSHPCQFLLFCPGENNLKKGTLQILQILFQGDVLVKLGWGSTPWKRVFFPPGALGWGRRSACARMSKRAFGTRLESEAIELEQSCLLTCQIQASGKCSCGGT